MRRSMIAPVALAAVCVLLSGCSGDDDGATGGSPTSGPAAGGGSPAPSAVVPFGAPGETANSGCSVFTAQEVGSALGLQTPRAEPLPGLPASIRACEYRGANGYLDLLVADQPTDGSARDAAVAAIAANKGDQPADVPGVGDAAVYLGKAGDQRKAAAAVETRGSQQHVVTLIGYLDSNPQQQLVSLLSQALNRT